MREDRQMWRVIASLGLACCGTSDASEPSSRPGQTTSGHAADAAPGGKNLPVTKPLTAPRTGSTRVEVASRELPSFELATKLVIDVEPPFRKATLEDAHTAAAAVRLEAPKLRPIRILRPAMITSVEENLAGARLAKANARQQGDCVITVEPDSSLVMIDCYSQAPAGPVACSWEGLPAEIDKVARICGSLGYE